MFRKKILASFLLLVIFFKAIITSRSFSYARTFTEDELVVVKNNGIVSAMCYVNNLLTGSVAKAIMALSVLGVGWLFLFGGASWIAVLLFTIATSLIFGGVELANLISGNNYSCKTFEDAEQRYDDLIYNKGVCGINEIDGIYSSGQLWKKCGGNVKITSSNVGSLCKGNVTNDTEINESDKVVLYDCQTGYLKKDKNEYLNYTCKRDNDGIGYFFPKNDKDDVGDTNNYEIATCLKACKLSDLRDYYNQYNLKQISDDKGNAEILSNDGYKGYLENGHYSQGTKLNVTCKDGYIVNTKDENGNCLNEADLGFICGDSGIFTLKKACQIACDINKVSDKLNVGDWNEKSVEKCRPNDLNKNMYISEDVLNAKTCKSGYGFEYKKDGSNIEIKCGATGVWTSNGNKCYKLCSKQNLQEILPGNKLIGCEDADTKNCNKNISNRNDFQYNEVVSITGVCDTEYSIIKNDIEKLVRYVCNENGNWEVTQQGRSCKKNCIISDKNNNLTGRDNTKSWLIFDKNNQIYKDLKTDVLENDQKIKPKLCKTGYNVYSDGAAEFICDDGKFSFASTGDVNEYCKVGCKFGELKNLKYEESGYDTSLSTKSWVMCTENGIENGEASLYGSLTNVDLFTTDSNKFARVDTYYKIKECNSGYKILSRRGDSLIVRCDSNGVWAIINNYGWNFCRLSPYCYELNNSSSGGTISIQIKTGGSINSLVKMQIWGASGGGLSESDNDMSSLGGYSYGEISLKEGEELYINVGAKGVISNEKRVPYNGGGYSAYVDGIISSTGGGASDIRYGGTALDNRILVAGGGGGSSIVNGKEYHGHKGGGIFELTNAITDDGYGIDGSSSFSDQSKFLNNIYNSFVTTGVRGVGGNSLIYYIDNENKAIITSAGGGGGGYYGGSGGALYGGGGGSGYVSGTIQNGLTTVIDDGPTDGGFARICWGDWFNLQNPCESDYKKSLSYKHNAGIGEFLDENKSITCEVLTESSIRDQQFKGIGKCTRDKLKTFLEEKFASMPDGITDDMLPENYYEGMTVRSFCQKGYEINSTKDGVDDRLEFICKADNNWDLNIGSCIIKFCDNKSLPENYKSEFNIIAGEDSKTEYNKTYDFSCKTGYENETNSTVTFRCNENKEWVDPSGKTCERKKCKIVDIINDIPDDLFVTNVSVWKKCIDSECRETENITDDRISFEDKAIISSCNSGYELYGANKTILTCNEEGKWAKVNKDIGNKCILSPACYEFTSTGSAKRIDFSTIHSDIDEIQIQLWGAPGGTTVNKPNLTYGGYSKGTLKLTNGKVVYVVVGGKGGSTTVKGLSSDRGLGGFNGGGDGGSNQCNNCSNFAPGAGGGGATDIRYGGLKLSDRAIVAGGGGGNAGHTNNDVASGKGGGVKGEDGNDIKYGATGGTQNSGGVHGNISTYNDLATNGVLGQGGHGTGYVPNANHKYYSWQYGGGGGGGYYGGGGSLTEGSGGGSGYIGGVTNGSTTTVSSGPTDSGFARICWGDWTGQTNPCSVSYTNSSSYKDNAGITTNTTKCIKNPNLSSYTPRTLNICTRTSLMTAFTNTHVKQPNNATANLPEKYYEGMKVRGDCEDGYSVANDSNGRVEFTCQSNGSWSVKGSCGILVKYVSISDSTKYKEKIFDNGTTVSCSNSTFGDPNYSTNKMCIIGTIVVAYEIDSFIASVDAKATEKCHKYFINASANIANSNFSNGNYVTNGGVNNNTIVNLSCNSGYVVNGQPKATCNKGAWKYSGSCIKGCKGKPNLTTNSVLCDRKSNNCSSFSEGTFYEDGKIISAPNSDNYNSSSFVAAHGAVLDVTCTSGYTEIKDGGTCHDCGGKSSSWSHYYYCDNGTWKYSGGCKKNCLNVKIVRTFSVSNEDNCGCDQSISCSINETISSINHNETVSRSCDTGDTTKKCSIFCTTYHRRVSGYCNATCNNGTFMIECYQTRKCSQGNNKACN